MGRVVSCYTVDDAVLDALPQCLYVHPRPQWRVHLGVRVIAFDSLVSEGQMMRRGLCRDPHAPRLRALYKLYRAPCAHMGYMEPSSRKLGKCDIPRDHRVFSGELTGGR